MTVSGCVLLGSTVPGWLGWLSFFVFYWLKKTFPAGLVAQLFQCTSNWVHTAHVKLFVNKKDGVHVPNAGC